MPKNKSGQLVCQHLENISSEALEKYQKIIKEYIKGRHGVYALYKKGKLYYAGLATDLRGRLKIHLRDKHAGKWDRFSIYLVIDSKHIKELETLILHIAKPMGNSQKGNFIKSENIERRFRKDINTHQKKELGQIFLDNEVSPIRDMKKDKILIKKGHTPTLAEYITRRIHIKWRYKGHLYIAHVRRDGTIVYARESYDSNRLQGKVFTSPSKAAGEVTKSGVDGWYAWKYERSPGEWVLLNELRRK